MTSLPGSELQKISREAWKDKIFELVALVGLIAIVWVILSL